MEESDVHNMKCVKEEIIIKKLCYFGLVFEVS